MLLASTGGILFPCGDRATSDAQRMLRACVYMVQHEGTREELKILQTLYLTWRTPEHKDRRNVEI